MPGRDDDELLAAYLDGVAELTPDERKRAEAAAAVAPDDVAATRALIGQLRALPPETSRDPDWAAMERSIRGAVGEHVPRPWWRRTWTWALPITACAAAAIAALVIGRAQPETEPAPLAHVEHVEHAPQVAPAAERAPLVYLDGEALDIDAIDPAVLDEVQLPDVADEESLVPTDHWVDRLDERGLDRAERVLANRKKG